MICEEKLIMNFPDSWKKNLDNDFRSYLRKETIKNNSQVTKSKGSILNWEEGGKKRTKTSWSNEGKKKTFTVLSLKSSALDKIQHINLSH